MSPPGGWRSFEKAMYRDISRAIHFGPAGRIYGSLHATPTSLFRVRVHGEVHFRKFGEELASEYRVGQIPSELGKEREREQDALRDVMDVDTSSDYDGNSSDGDGPEDKIILGRDRPDPARPTPQSTNAISIRRQSYAPDTTRLETSAGS
ncbi:hypothetical protein QBC46DRAFT_348387 [Diplogelasinospora grovesii]|uniref:Uncharacterized protein n=1 Tax=Diplogelasinospora grovesii TaxID=303347 RepID=A0AAN6RYP1_9PEZI|nr:hypothetical protein QBC46DRAFT_348387 [Diplogelasinospora grovesii]